MEIIDHRTRPFKDLDGHHDIEEPGCCGCIVGAIVVGAVMGLFLAWALSQ